MRIGHNLSGIKGRASVCKHSAVVLAALLPVMSAVDASAATFSVIPTRASGVEGVDWYFGPAPDEITLTHGDQDVELKVYAADWSPAIIAAHDIKLDCASLFASVTGRAIAIGLECYNGSGVYNVDFCVGTNTEESDPPHILAPAGSTVEGCNTTVLCPDDLPGAYQCGSVAVFGDSGPDVGEARYLGHFSISVPDGTQGVIPVTLEVGELDTFLGTPTGERISPEEVFAARVTVLPTGACCNGGAFGCVEDSTENGCLDAGGSFFANIGCDGLDSDGDGSPDTCDVCPGLDDSLYAPECVGPVPTVSTWGLGVLTMLLLIAGKLFRFNVRLTRSA